MLLLMTDIIILIIIVFVLLRRINIILIQTIILCFNIYKLKSNFVNNVFIKIFIFNTYKIYKIVFNNSLC